MRYPDNSRDTDTAGQQLFQRACRLLARREYSRQELRQRLARTDVDTELLQAVLERLHSSGLQSDERYTNAFILQRVERGTGSVGIRQALQQRGIAAALIERCIQAQSIDWEQLAARTRARRFGPELPHSGREAGRQARFLLARGFDEEQFQHLFTTVE